MQYLKPWQRVIGAIAMAKVMVGLGLYLSSIVLDAAGWQTRDTRFFAFLFAFGVVAAFLLTAGRADLRATVLGIAFILVAAVFSDNAATLTRWNSVASWAKWLFAIRVDAFTGYFLWYFVREFPREVAFGPRRTIPEFGMRIASWLGAILLVINFAAATIDHAVLPASVRSFLTALDRRDGGSLYWPFQYLLTVAGLVALIWKSRVVPVSDRRRVRLLIAGLIVGCAPTALWTLVATLLPSFRAGLPVHQAGWVLYPTLLSTPAMTAYAVLAHQALNVRLIVRQAIRYALARYSVLALTAIPATVLAVQLYRRRDEPLAEMIGGMSTFVFALLITAALLVARVRRTLLDRLDKHFFREQYDARHILAELATRAISARTVEGLASILSAEVERALHPERVDVFFLDQSKSLFTSTTRGSRPLSANSPLISTLAAAGHLSLDLAAPDRVPRWLDEETRIWLADFDARVIVPLEDAEHIVLAVLVLGEKRSELPYSREDLLMLRTAADTMSVALGRIEGRAPDPLTRRGESDGRAWICDDCGMVWENGGVCGRCRSALVPCQLPRMIGGKIRIEERIGRGGMGVVYRGTDLSLRRTVAVKTLPLSSPDRAVRMRREARTMAAISHPNLAMILAAESWNGLPLLIVEYLPGDTLASRLGRGPLPREEALRIAISLADVAAAIHNAQIVHRDIKPANIAFAADGTPKLLDFGLAHLLGDAGNSGSHSVPGDDRLAGTAAYLSPEALRGAGPNPSFDVWSISVVLFEMLAGRVPVQAASLAETVLRISAGRLATLRELNPQADPDLSLFLESALSQRLADRPTSAAALQRELTRLLGHSRVDQAA